MKVWVLGFVAALNTLGAVYNVGDTPADECWLTLAPVVARYCLSDIKKNGDVAVIVRNAGWCEPCNREFKELAPLAAKYFAGKKVEFVSVSAEGATHGSVPDNAFMKAWDEKFGLNASKATWIVASDYRNFGHKYFSSPRIPNVEIIDADGKLVFKQMGPHPKDVIRHVQKALR